MTTNDFNIIFDSYSTDFTKIDFQEDTQFNNAKAVGSLNDYNQLVGKPSINDVVLVGNKTPKELGIKEDATFEFTQLVPSAE